MEIIGTTEQRWPNDDGPWALRLTLGIVGDRPGVVGVELYAVDPDAIRTAAKGWPSLAEPYKPSGSKAITTAEARLPLAELLNGYLSKRRRRDQIVTNAHPLSGFSDAQQRAAAKRLKALTLPSTRSPGRPAIYTVDHWEKVAAAYTKALRAGQSPTDVVRQEFMVSRSAAVKWVARCRELGLLPPTTKGKAAGWAAPEKKERKNARLHP